MMDRSSNNNFYEQVDNFYGDYWYKDQTNNINDHMAHQNQQDTQDHQS